PHPPRRRPPAVAPSPRVPRSVRKPSPSASLRKPRVAFILDDMGQRPSLERKFFDLGIIRNFSFLPQAPFTPRLAREAHRRGFTVMVHLPMEAEDRNPPGGLTVSMSEKEIRRRTRYLLSLVPYAEGVNQHMGSLFSQDPVRMLWVMEEIKKKGLFFVDSRTTPQTMAPFVAASLKIRFAQRDVFLDNSLDRRRLEAVLRSILQKAHRKGKLVVIVHPHPQTLWLFRRYRQTILREVQPVSVKILLEVPS
ncbi:divergent polysaccharide deacetylase family protein, partial [Thermosulfurimonas sp.]|uniref:divergent polysaccharide deacetylase family protein n=1 Tax=Thermosulfurimonas sp. TaxID=2080236 RepID=UPI0025FD554E